MKKITLTFVLIFTVVLTGLNAQDANNPWVIGFGANAIHEPGTKKIEDFVRVKDWNVIPSISRLSIGKYIDDGFTFEAVGTVNEITKIGKVDVSAVSFFALDGHFKYDLNNLVGQTSFFDPYILLGGGYTWVDSDGTGTFNAGAGFNLWFNENIGLNFQTSGKHVFNDFYLEKNHLQHSAGLVIKFGGKDTDKDGIYDKFDLCPEVPGLPQFKGCPDTDGDGIQDSEDTCPNVAGLAEFQGCPDTDGDGIPDNLDACPKEKGTKANNGCPDTDNDGVLDKDDACPTVAGPKENKGCPWPDTDGDGTLDKDDKCPKEAGPKENGGCPWPTFNAVTLDNFKQGSAKLIGTNKVENSDTFKSILNEVIAYKGKVNSITVKVDGYASEEGTERLNKKLSLQRAEAVKALLMKNEALKDVAIEAVGNGELTGKPYLQNRKVVVSVNKQ
ncbi:MAG: thrombospondin type 3 repeat-containing protein [Flavobacteriaceae bacterium]|nr:thrombospondin type 3 repeat-containing protein [Flavobacteriaceae bacterium]